MECGTHTQIVASIDINTNANSIYSHNFPDTPHLNRNICGMTAEELDRYNSDVFTMSPPCQPFTRQGLRRDNSDHRTDSFFHLMELMTEMKRPPEYILVENVQGFEASNTREHFVGILQQFGYSYQEFFLSPGQFSIPNSRLRYYLLAKRGPLSFSLQISEQPCRSSLLLLDFVQRLKSTLEKLSQPSSISDSSIKKLPTMAEAGKGAVGETSQSCG